MKERVLERPGVSDVPRAMQQAERWLLGQGFTATARSAAELQFLSTRGGPLRLTVQFATVVRCTFAPAAPGASLPDERELERLADGAASPGGTVSTPAPAAPRPSAGGGTRCSICATVIPAGATECPLCGMSV